MRVTKHHQAPHFAAADVQPADVWCIFINSVVIVYEATVCVHTRAGTGTSLVYSVASVKPTGPKLVVLGNLRTINRNGEQELHSIKISFIH